MKQKENDKDREKQEQVGTHRSDIGPCLAPSSNLHKIGGTGLRERTRGHDRKETEKQTVLVRRRQSRDNLGICKIGQSQY